MQWRDDQPIYRQLYQRMVALIVAGDIAPGEALPSVRQVAADYQINHLTVAKAYQALVDEQLVEKRRGLGMFVRAGADVRLREREREQFVQQLPELLAQARRLGMDKEALVKAINSLKEES
ncbi:GntR family transcriptional regulator [Gilvimarinus sp. DA14]|uniref:GntR family transcriptional regulator n=1 Tax=Gilvimarinus sp. DA14 TaxID=2956798 RepID=UPI0020B7F95E|nr:GntR family transcriptional regulator [Gilvimarinus sp. DA14]UTF58857.1 GntR family transcriptional regulator [Gilvimarinus sp. DA14]